MRRPQLHYSDVLEWADEHKARTGNFPTLNSGRVAVRPDESWIAIESALRAGNRGFPGGSSLAQLLAKKRGYRNIMRLPKLSLSKILKWADDYRKRTGEYPTQNSELVDGHPDEKWLNLDMCLRMGLRGLSGGSSLAQLLADRRGRRNRKGLPRYNLAQILKWADCHRERTESWPLRNSGAIREAKGETWAAVDDALRQGLRGLKGDSSLPQFLAERRGVRNLQDLPELTISKILQWADAHKERTGTWPPVEAVPIPESPQDTWAAVNSALYAGSRGLPGGSSLARLLAKKRGYRNRKALPKLTTSQILKWADAHHKRTGRWPTEDAGEIADGPGENWNAVANALRVGIRGLTEGSSLAQLLAEQRNVRNHLDLPSFSIKEILQWANAHHGRTGNFPLPKCGPVQESPGDTWQAVNQALRKGHRGLPGGSSLSKLLAEQRGTNARIRRPPHTISQIHGWAKSHYARTGRWPSAAAGAVHESLPDTWGAVQQSLLTGARGLPGGSSPR